MTGPGWASTTRTSTPKSLSFFSIMRLVISRVSLETVSWRSKASSSSATWGSLLSGMSANKGFWRSLATRSLLGTATIRCGSTNTRGSGCGTSGISATGSWPGPPSCGSGASSWCISSSRSRRACWPISLSWANSRRSCKDCQRASSQAPMPSALRSQEKRNAQPQPSKPNPIASKADPAKPNACTALPPST